MKNISTIILLSVIFLTGYVVKAQVNYKKGYVVSLTNDTLRGFIDQREWSRNPSTVTFRNADQEENVFSNHDIKYIEVEGGVRYVRAVLAISIDEVGVYKNSSGEKHFNTIDTVFLKIIISGKYSTLYSYKDKIKERYFLSYGGMKPEELVYKLYREGVDMYSVNSFRSQLMAAAKASDRLDEKMLWKIKKSTYGSSSLEEIVREVNGISKNDLRKAGAAGRFHYFVGLGVTRSTLGYEGGSLWAKHASSSVYFSPNIAAGVDFYANPEVGKLIFRGVMTFDMVKNHTQSFYDSLTYQNQIDLSYTQYNLNFTGMVIDNLYNTKKLKVYLGAGMAINLSSYANNNLIQSKVYIDHTTSDFTRNYKYSSFWYSIPVQIGCVYNNLFEFKASYSFNTSMSDLNDLYFYEYFKTTQIGVNYFLKRRNKSIPVNMRK